jgi:hypothetical protein
VNPSPCSGFEPLLERLADGEAAADESLRVREHLSACPDCRVTLKAGTDLHRRIAQSPAPPTPPDLEDRLRRALAAADRPRRRAWIPALAAAAILAAAYLALRPNPARPEFVAAASAAHDEFLSGAGDDRIIYRHGGTPVSMIVVDELKGRLPKASLRSRSGRPYHVFLAGDNTVLACPKGHLWISRLPEEELAACALDTREALSGERIPIAGLVCRECCARAESRVKKIDGVADARVNLGSMELIVAGKKRLDVDRIVRELREAGLDVRAK